MVKEPEKPAETTEEGDNTEAATAEGSSEAGDDKSKAGPDSDKTKDGEKKRRYENPTRKK